MILAYLGWYKFKATSRIKTTSHLLEVRDAYTHDHVGIKCGCNSDASTLTDNPPVTDNKPIFHKTQYASACFCVHALTVLNEICGYALNTILTSLIVVGLNPTVDLKYL
jgi:hypothetical protein